MELQIFFFEIPPFLAIVQVDHLESLFAITAYLMVSVVELNRRKNYLIVSLIGRFLAMTDSWVVYMKAAAHQAFVQVLLVFYHRPTPDKRLLNRRLFS
jgi:hypothetical protein